jgi:2-polyprenyl-3-methyl-5-hydroxy-6-metoxy-1,4-benzoquinol methylase
MEEDNSTDQPIRQSTRWDFAAVDAAPDLQSVVRYLQQHPGNEGEGEARSIRRQLSYDLLEVYEGQHLLDVGCGLGDDVRALARLVGASGRVVRPGGRIVVTEPDQTTAIA